MPLSVTYLVLAALPAVAFWVARIALERFTLGPGRSGTARAPERPVERLVADLSRLEQDYRKVERSEAPGRATRLRAIRLAYDDTLRSCCRAVGLPTPERSPLSAVHRLETEAALSQAGLTW